MNVQQGPVNGVGAGELVIFGIGLVVVLAVITGLVLRSFWAHDDRARDLDGDVQTGLSLLEQRVADLAAALEGQPEGPAAQALSDARGRLAAAQELRAQSRSLVVSKAVRGVLLEGLTAVREGGRLAGRDPGPEVPAPTEAELVESPVRVRVKDAEHLALPAYAPGHPHHFSGGLIGEDEVPGGWYATDFWTDAV